jgi:ribosome maturation factor RimP
MALNIVWTRWMAHSSGVLRGAAFCLAFGSSGCRFWKISVRGKTPEDHRLLELLDPVAEAAGYEIVRLRMMGGQERRTLQIMAEDAHGEMMVEDCAILSRALSQVLEAADPISGEYVLEVSSPGIDRPLTRFRDFETFEGYEAKIELDRLAEGRKRFKGLLAGIEDDNVAIDLEGEEDTALLPFAWIVDAKLTLTDELMKRGAEQRAARLEAEGLLADNQSESEEEA